MFRPLTFPADDVPPDLPGFCFGCARDILVLRLTPTAGLVQLGYGIYQKRIQASETSNTSAIAVDMCQDKTMTNRMLRAVGVPVPLRNAAFP